MVVIARSCEALSKSESIEGEAAGVSVSSVQRFSFFILIFECAITFSLNSDCLQIEKTHGHGH